MSRQPVTSRHFRSWACVIALAALTLAGSSPARAEAPCLPPAAPPQRIEVYDNSHISGTNAVGAMIVAGEQRIDIGALAPPVVTADLTKATLDASGEQPVLVITVLLLWRARRSERPPSWGLWLLCLAPTSFNGVYLPLGPLLVLVSLLAGLPRRAQPTRHSVD